MNTLTLYLVAGFVALGLGFAWFAYLVKIVMNDEEVQERIRRIQRQREERRRAMEDKIRKHREAEKRFKSEVSDIARGEDKPTAASDAGDKASA